jgi:hypothetical protein
MNSRIIFNGPFAKESIVLKVMFDIDASDSPKISPLRLERNLQGLNNGFNTFPPLIE